MFSLPPEIQEKNILSQLELVDALSVDETCKSLHALKSLNAHWVELIYKRWGIRVHEANAEKKFLLLYYFHKALELGLAWNEKEDSIEEKSCLSYLAKVDALIKELGEIHSKDVGWVSHVQGVKAGLLSADEVGDNQFLQAVLPLTVSSVANYMPATVLLACINLRSAFQEIYDDNSNIFPGGIDTHIASFNLSWKIGRSSIPGQENPQTGLDLLKRAYQEKSPEAALIYAALVWEGLNQTLPIPQDKQAAIKIISADFCAEDLECLLLLGRFRLSLLRARTDLADEEFFREMDWVLDTFKQAANHGSAEAAVYLNKFYSTWRPRTELLARYINIDESFLWFERAAELEDVAAVYQRAVLYQKGSKTICGKQIFRPISIPLALKNYEIGARCRKVDTDSLAFKGLCLLNLIDIHSSGEHGITPNLREVLRLFARGAKMGYVPSMLQRGGLYVFGNPHLGLNPDEQKAEEYFNSLLISPVFQTARSAAVSISDFFKDEIFLDPELALQYYIKWCLRRVKLESTYEGGKFILSILNVAAAFHLSIKNQAAYDQLKEMIEKMSPVREGHPGFNIFLGFVPNVDYQKNNKNTDLTPLAELFYQAIGLPYTPDEFLRQNDPVKIMRAALSSTQGINPPRAAI